MPRWSVAKFKFKFKFKPGGGLRLRAIAAACAAGAMSATTTRTVIGAVDPLSGIDFVTIGATYGGAGNPAWPGTNPPPPFEDLALGRGRVGYEYKIGKFEVTTAQWVEFFNAAFDRPVADRIPWVVPATQTHWGATGATPNTPGGLRWSVPAGNEMRPVGNISWRTAAIYCNWLHNGKSLDRSAFLNGAYDVSTFGGSNIFTDQATHNPGAKYWIPTWDEWLKAAHFDPNKNNGAGGWWLYSNGTDTPLNGGPPGVGEANFGFTSPNPFSIPLGSYPDVQSPWGLLDVAGATSEWTEQIFTGTQGIKSRTWEGSFWGSTTGSAINDAAYVRGGTGFPTLDTFDLGFRIASAVPSSPTACVLIGASLLSARRRRRAESECREGFHPSPPPHLSPDRSLQLTPDLSPELSPLDAWFHSPRGSVLRALRAFAFNPRRLCALAAGCSMGLWSAAPRDVAAAIDPLSGIDFVTIGATYGGAGNPAYQSGIPNQRVNGRGSVNYEYNIGRMEVTTSQWVEFFNAAFDRPQADWIPWVAPPDFWGAIGTAPNTPGGLRWSVPAGNENRAVGDISWRMAAIHCNWLHNGKSLDRSAFLNGAYDVSTFGFFGNIFTDQLTHHPDAKYWVPTWDEWLKAAHFDPDKDNGDGTTGGWWQYGNTSDTLPVYGPPGVGEANAGSGGLSSFSVPLGAYPDVQSPWGLLDVAGGTSEWTETVFFGSASTKYRVYDGSHWLQDTFQSSLVDRLRSTGGAEFPHIASFETGLRIAFLVPTPGAGALGVGVFFVCVQRRRRSSRPSAHAGAAMLLR